MKRLISFLLAFSMIISTIGYVPVVASIPVGGVTMSYTPALMAVLFGLLGLLISGKKKTQKPKMN